jgi:hypothetical protein
MSLVVRAQGIEAEVRPRGHHRDAERNGRSAQGKTFEGQGSVAHLYFPLEGSNCPPEFGFNRKNRVKRS